MTEEEWLTTDDFWQMHGHLWETVKGRPRKYRLAGCGVFRLIRQGTFSEEEARLLDLGESFADDPLLADRVAAYKKVDEIPNTFPFDVCYPPEYGDYGSNSVARVVSFMQDRLEDSWWEQHPSYDDDEDEAQREAGRNFQRQADVAGATVLRDIFGNPFRPAALDSAWLTSTVVALAEGIYAEKAFDRMPILADALQDAGCDNDDILNHCRDTSAAHVRGCWVIDLLTGRG